jgi:hypothetical protein
LVIAARTLRGLFKQKHKMTAMVGMRRGPAGHFPQEITRHDRVGIGAAHPALRGFRYAARPHVTDAAADPRGPERALNALGIHAGKARVHAVLFGFSQKLD